MCFSAQADLIAGVAVGVIGIDAARHVRRPSERALAALPIVLAAHQLVEVLVWKGLEGEVAESVWRPAMMAYLVIAFAVLPVLVPVAVGALEPVPNRRRMVSFMVLGVFVAAALLRAMVRGPVTADIEGRHVAYYVDLQHGGALVALYVIATCGSLLVSSHRQVRWFGAANLVVAGLLAWLYETAFISLWCGWAAMVSLGIAWHLRRGSAPADSVLQRLDQELDQETPA